MYDLARTKTYHEFVHNQVERMGGGKGGGDRAGEGYYTDVHRESGGETSTTTRTRDRRATRWLTDGLWNGSHWGDLRVDTCLTGGTISFQQRGSG